MANKLNKGSIDCILLELGDKGSYVDPENMQVDELGIVDDNFVKTSENLFREREEILKNND